MEEAFEKLSAAMVKNSFIKPLTNMPYRLIKQYDDSEWSSNTVTDNAKILKMVQSQSTTEHIKTNDFGPPDIRPTQAPMTLREFLFSCVPEKSKTSACRIFCKLEKELYGKGGYRVYYDKRYATEAANYIQYAPLYLERSLGAVVAAKYLSATGLTRRHEMQWDGDTPTCTQDRIMKGAIDILHTRFEIDFSDMEIEPSRMPVVAMDDITLNSTPGTQPPPPAPNGPTTTRTMAEDTATLERQLFPQDTPVGNPAPTDQQPATLTPNPHSEGAASGQQG